MKTLNAVAKTDTYGLFNTTMQSSTHYKGITRFGTDGNYTYNANAGWENRPVAYVLWYGSLRFINWLQNGQLTGSQNSNTTENGAYTISGATTVSARNVGANYWLPSEDEWYKVAYYNPTSGVYYDYATGSNTLPNNNAPVNDTGNSANLLFRFC